MPGFLMFAIQTLDRGKWWLEARLAAVSLQRIKERGFFTADVGARTAMDDHFAIPAAAQDVFADQPRRPGLFDRPH